MTLIPAPSGAFVLLVGCDSATARILGGVLRLQGWRLEESAPGASALARALQPEVGAVFFDISADAKKAYERLALLRSHEYTARRPGVPVVAVSARSGEEDRAKAIAAGFVAQLAKPLHPAAVHAALQRVLDLREEISRNRDSQDKRAIVERVMNQNHVDEYASRLPGVWMASNVEAGITDLLFRLLLAALESRPVDARKCAQQLSQIALHIGGRRLAELADAILRRAQGPGEEIERAGVLAKAELDRVVFSLREAVLSLAGGAASDLRGKLQ